ncbi:TetR/AcrR family transcriptional regulator [Ornithinicoccus hortensis]|uniref:TetR family transcriptional regulator n=1 Tax=Ornithinicoccus hortensis TaxID=82346 RepID=A0A542YR83_9MICO|nr:TetR/AcrR family transcriptional regulator [Ornithinicoccus hortensis]TQL50557.1 TetR family transcriptional regulator [Ornithinicoccus hortensis]
MSATPTTRKGLRTRQSIVEAGRGVFARDGFVSARMGDIAEAAGLSMGGLYRYFANKEDVFEAVIADVHEGLFQASVSTNHDFRTEPYEALLEANRGYLQRYYEYRDVMRAFMEAAHVDKRFRDFWWSMRSRHVERFLGVMGKVSADGGESAPDLRLAAEAVACMVEQSAYVWFAQDELYGATVDVEDATRVVTQIWHGTFFPEKKATSPS